MIRRSGMAFAVSSLAVATVATSSASAQFVNGQVIQGRYYYPNVNTPYNDPLYDFTRTLVDGTDFTSGYDAGWRFDFVGNRFRIDFFLPSDANYFYFDLADGHTFNGYTLKDLNGTIPSFAGASVAASTQGNWSNVLTVASADMLVLDFRRLGQHFFYQGDFVEFEVQFLPTPGALALLALGGIGVRRRAR